MCIGLAFHVRLEKAFNANLLIEKGERERERERAVGAIPNESFLRNQATLRVIITNFKPGIIICLIMLIIDNNHCNISLTHSNNV